MASPYSERLRGIDWLRGLAMVLMVVDHVRVYAGVPAGGPEPAVFFTRWITHFCAPAFVFLAGTSIWLRAQKHDDTTGYLLSRGLLLIVLEFTAIRLFWTFNLDYAHYALAGVIWVIGICMVLMAGLAKLGTRAALAFGLLLVFGHNLVDVLPGARTALGDGALAKLSYLGPTAGPIQWGELQFNVLYSIVPWIGVMAVGYGFGRVLALPPERRDRLCRWLGLAAIGLFLLLRAGNSYGDPRPWQAGGEMPAWLSFLNASKYPASLSFLLMTLGPALLLMPLANRLRDGVSDALVSFGREPLFFYLLHIPLVHALALGVSWLRTGAIDPWLFADHPMGNPPAPDGYAWPLWLLYLVWAVAVALLYVAVRVYERRKG